MGLERRVVLRECSEVVMSAHKLPSNLITWTLDLHSGLSDPIPEMLSIGHYEFWNEVTYIFVNFSKFKF